MLKAHREQDGACAAGISGRVASRPAAQLIFFMARGSTQNSGSQSPSTLRATAYQARFERREAGRARWMFCPMRLRGWPAEAVASAAYSIRYRKIFDKNDER
ncbi:MAG: hypothetical protein ACLR23_07580 [Clostridia bacterium]